MSARGIARYATVKGVATPTNAPIYIDSDDNIVKVVPAGSGTTEVQIVDASSAQTLTNKTFTAPTITDALLNLPVAEFVGDGAVTVTPGVKVLTKTSAGAYTLAAPTTEGDVVILIAGTSFAHVVTGTNLFWAGETGGPFNKVTTAAFIGSAAVLVGWNGLWMVVADQIATIGD